MLNKKYDPNYSWDDTATNEFYLYFETSTIIMAFIGLKLLLDFKKSLNEEYYRHFYGEDARAKSLIILDKNVVPKHPNHNCNTNSSKLSLLKTGIGIGQNKSF